MQRATCPTSTETQGGKSVTTAAETSENNHITFLETYNLVSLALELRNPIEMVSNEMQFALS